VVPYLSATGRIRDTETVSCHPQVSSVNRARGSGHYPNSMTEALVSRPYVVLQRVPMFVPLERSSWCRRELRRWHPPSTSVMRRSFRADDADQCCRCENPLPTHPIDKTSLSCSQCKPYTQGHYAVPCRILPSPGRLEFGAPPKSAHGRRSIAAIAHKWGGIRLALKGARHESLYVVELPTAGRAFQCLLCAVLRLSRPPAQKKKNSKSRGASTSG